MEVLLWVGQGHTEGAAHSFHQSCQKLTSRFSHFLLFPHQATVHHFPATNYDFCRKANTAPSSPCLPYCMAYDIHF